jgi:hypothetical protein
VKALILQWNGTTWTQVPSSDPGHVPQYLHAVAAGPAGTGWAVGGTAGPYTQAVGALASPESVILRWSDVR